MGTTVATAGMPAARAQESASREEPAPSLPEAVAPWVSPALPLPRETIVFTGRIGSSSRPVVLQKRRPSGWQAIRRSTTQSNGNYRFSLVAATSSRTYRIVAPPNAGKRRLVSPTRTVALSTGARWWSLNDRCRGNGEQAACAARDDLTKRGGKIVRRDLYVAWLERDYTRVGSLVRSSSDVQWYRNVRPATPFRDCAYDASEPRWLCWVRATTGTWYSTRFEVTSLRPGSLPVWKGGPLAPDV